MRGTSGSRMDWKGLEGSGKWEVGMGAGIAVAIESTLAVALVHSCMVRFATTTTTTTTTTIQHHSHTTHTTHTLYVARQEWHSQPVARILPS